MPTFQPYWGKPAVRNDRGDRGNVGIIRSPVRASILPDCGGRGAISVPTATIASQVFVSCSIIVAVRGAAAWARLGRRQIRRKGSDRIGLLRTCSVMPVAPVRLRA